MKKIVSITVSFLLLFSLSISSFAVTTNAPEAIITDTVSNVLNDVTVKTKTVHHQIKLDSLTLNFKVSILYEHWNVGIHIWEEFLQVNDISVSLEEGLIDVGTYDRITKIAELRGEIVDGGKRAKISYDVDVTTYLGVADVIKVPINTARCHGSFYIDAKVIN